MPGDHAYSRLSMSMSAGMLRAIGKLNVPVYRATRGRLMNKVGRAPVLLLTSIGRRSGQPRTAPVLYLRDGEHVIVIGSNAGNVRTPAWSLNLQANPEAEIQIGGERRAVRARVAAAEERAELWGKMNEQYEGFDDYATRTTRDIAVFVLEPR
jgi:deazaflavin-dependent oxidoreductase (nitroreductase family)